ncbi:uncharacterized protein LOC106067101 [Biomphalaria glabrata]|uniref:Uncharacterized protein LOC106067101 n=1 Tax=Biomphalaria glabrata TaxID=6526 RepID=A0A9W2YZU9_BIOGL|nr:uncharacterized protein LOC106067101 [Biomphalaria glabrata]KAI8750939.1 methyltransferase-like protein 24 [Biomphalaria glabrata]KAI8772243.1 methyltransferase protein 24 [Biomphalaria glabrata]
MEFRMSYNVVRGIVLIGFIGGVVMFFFHFRSPVVTLIANSDTVADSLVTLKYVTNLEGATLRTDIGTGPLSVVREKGRVRNLAEVDLDKMSSQELLLTIHSYVDSNQIICQRKFRMGNIGDGGWEICDDPDVRPREPCIIYSFGISNDFSFDDDAAKMYGCHVYSFDPSMTKEKDQFDRSSNVHFYKIGIDGKTYVNSQQWKLFAHRDIRKMLGHANSTIAVIKMDVESSEWGAIPEMFESGELANTRQLLMEFHIVSSSRDYLLPRLKAIQAIEKSGLRIFYTHKNHACGTTVAGFPLMRTMCYEVHYLRR